MLRNHPILNALIWTAVGALVGGILLLTYQSLWPGTQKSDAELDREAAAARR